MGAIEERAKNLTTVVKGDNIHQLLETLIQGSYGYAWQREQFAHHMLTKMKDKPLFVPELFFATYPTIPEELKKQVMEHIAKTAIIEAL